MQKAQRDISLQQFAKWLQRYGRSDGTIELYCTDIRKALSEGGLIKRLGDTTLAPKTRRHILAAARAWAKFHKDRKLQDDLEKIKLPAAERVTAKVPLPRDKWFALIDAINAADERPEIIAALGIMATRGLRAGDVLKLQRGEIVAALKNSVLGFAAKGGRRLEFAVLETYRRYLEILCEKQNWRQVEDLISPNATNRRKAGRRCLQRHLQAIAGQMGLEPTDVYPHRLRRTYATEYLRALGKDPEAVIKLKQHMQWANLATAFSYVDHHRGAELDTVALEMFGATA